MKYIYTAVFTIDGDKVMTRIPDLPGCISSGCDLNDAIAQITDAASSYLVVAEDNDLTIAAATDQSLIHKDGSELFSLIQVDTNAYRALLK